MQGSELSGCKKRRTRAWLSTCSARSESHTVGATAKTNFKIGKFTLARHWPKHWHQQLYVAQTADKCSPIPKLVDRRAPGVVLGIRHQSTPASAAVHGKRRSMLQHRAHGARYAGSTHRLQGETLNATRTDLYLFVLSPPSADLQQAVRPSIFPWSTTLQEPI